MQRLKRALGRLLPKGQFARSVGVLVGGTAGAQLLMVIAAPLLTRLYSPEDFGLLAVYGSLLALLSVVASLRYELAIPLPEDDEDAANVAALSLLLIAGTTLSTVLITTFFGTTLAQTLGVPALAAYVWLLPVGVLLGGLYTVFNYWSIRTKRFSTIAGIKLRQSLATIAIQLAAFKLGGGAMILGQVAGQSVGTLGLARPALRLPAFKAISWQGIGKAAVRYQRFPIFSTWEGLSNTAGLQLPPLMFAAFFSPMAAGLYTLANRILSLPMALVGQAIGQVFFANAANAYRTGDLGPLVAGLHAKLAHIGIPPALLLILLGPELFDFVFGAAWRQAGEFARWMAPWLYLVFVSSPLSTVFAVVERQKQGLLFQLVLLLSRIGAILIGAKTGDIQLTVILFSACSALCWLGFLFWVAHIAGNTVRSMIMPTLAAAGVGLLCVLPVLVTQTLNIVPSNFWPVAFILSLLMISACYWKLLKQAY